MKAYKQSDRLASVSTRGKTFMVELKISSSIQGQPEIRHSVIY